MTFEKKNDAVFVYHKAGYGSKFKYLFVSDIHTDSQHSDLKTLEKLLKQAVDCDAGIFIIGDLFDAMGHNMDKRTTKGDIKAAHNHSAYFNSIIDECFKFLKPYAENIIMISKGNHEHKILERQEYDLLSALIYRLNMETGSKIIQGDYYGWIKFMFDSVNGGGRKSKTAYYTHGSGGAATMSFGALKVKRRQAIIDADIFISGHIHQSYNIPLGKYYVSDQGKEHTKECLHLSLGTFEETNGWGRAKEFDPAPKNGWWLEFTRKEHEIDMLEIRAK